MFIAATVANPNRSTSHKSTSAPKIKVPALAGTDLQTSESEMVMIFCVLLRGGILETIEQRTHEWNVKVKSWDLEKKESWHLLNNFWVPNWR